MSAGAGHENGEDLLAAYGFARVVIDRPAGQLVAAMGEEGRWIVRIRRRGDEPWRLACTGDVDSLTVETDLPREPTEPIVVGPVEIRPGGRRVLIGAEEVALSPKEYDALLLLARDPTRVLTKEELMDKVWGHGAVGATRTLDSHMSRLRRKLAAAGAEGLIANCWGVGYSLLPGEPDPNGGGRDA